MIVVALILMAGALQMHGALAVYGIRPDLMLVVLIVSALFTDNFLLYLLLTLIASIGIRFAPGFGPEAFALVVVSLGVFAVKSKIVWPGLLGSAILIGAGTIAVYTLGSMQFLFRHPGIVAAEALYNIVLAAILYEVLQLITRYEKKA